MIRELLRDALFFDRELRVHARHQAVFNPLAVGREIILGAVAVSDVAATTERGLDVAGVAKSILRRAVCPQLRLRSRRVAQTAGVATGGRPGGRHKRHRQQIADAAGLLVAHRCQVQLRLVVLGLQQLLLRRQRLCAREPRDVVGRPG